MDAIIQHRKSKEPIKYRENEKCCFVGSFSFIVQPYSYPNYKDVKKRAKEELNKREEDKIKISLSASNLEKIFKSFPKKEKEKIITFEIYKERKQDEPILITNGSTDECIEALIMQVRV